MAGNVMSWFFVFIFPVRYAIYVPLFIPMAVPVLASLLQAIKLYKQLRQARKQQEQGQPEEEATTSSVPEDKLKVSWVATCSMYAEHTP